MEAFAARLKRTRTDLVLSQKDLAERSGVPVVTISRLENARGKQPQPGTIRKLAEAMNVEPKWLRDGDDG